MSELNDKRIVNPSFDSSIRGDSDNEVKTLFQQAKHRREERMKYQLLNDLLDGKTVDITKSKQLFEALNREKMTFEQLLAMNPEEANACVERVKADRQVVNAGGRWWNAKSKARWGKKGSIPPCCFYARPKEYWHNENLVNYFFNQFPKFRVSERPL